MRKNVFGRRLKRDKNERKALFKGLISSLVLNEKIKTTEAKAKAIRGQVEKLVTMARKDASRTNRFLYKYLTGEAIEKLVVSIAPRFINRAGGYTRMIKIGERFSDNARMVLMEWVEGEVVNEKTATTRLKTPEVPATSGQTETQKKKETQKKRRNNSL